jgi:hypothetical protein
MLFCFHINYFFMVKVEKLNFKQEGMPAQPTRPTHPCEPKSQPHVTTTAASSASDSNFHVERFRFQDKFISESEALDWRSEPTAEEAAVIVTWDCHLDSHRESSGWVALAPPLET